MNLFGAGRSLRLLAYRLRRALSTNQAETNPQDPDPRLQGRTYGVPFQRVWEEVLSLASGGMRGWSLGMANDQEGTVEAEAHTLFLRFVDDVVIEVGLDSNGQTRVDLRSRSRTGRIDFGTNARRIHRFLKRLDRSLGLLD